MLAHTVVALCLSAAPALLHQPAQPPAAAPAPAPPPAYTLPLAERFKSMLPLTALAQAGGFYYARMMLADKMMAAQPDMTEALKAAQMSFRAQYEPGFQAVMRELARREPGFNQEWEATIKPALNKQLEGKAWTKAEVEDAIKVGTFDPRRQSSNERVILCALLPAYIEKPFHEFNEGYTLVSYAGITGDDAHRYEVTHPVSWGRLDTGSKSLVIVSATGAGPFIVKFDIFKNADTAAAKDGAALKALLEKYGPKPAQGEWFSEIRVTDDQTAAVRDKRTTSAQLAQTIRTIGRYTATVKDGTLFIVLTACFTPVDPAHPEAEDQQIESLLAKYQPVMGKVMASLKLESAPPPAATAPAPAPAPGR